VVSSNGGGAHAASRSLLRAPLRCIVSCCMGSLSGETLSSHGCATATQFCVVTSLRHRIWRTDLDGRWWWLFGGVACARRQMRCAWSGLAGRCRGTMGTRGLELVRLVVCSMASAGRRCCSLGGFSGI
jgi:hypothetical protein